MRLFGHPVHQMMIVFPVGLLIAAVVFDLIALLTPLSVHRLPAIVSARRRQRPKET